MKNVFMGGHTEEKSVSAAVQQITGKHAGSSSHCHVISITATRRKAQTSGKGFFKWDFVQLFIFLYG